MNLSFNMSDIIEIEENIAQQMLDDGIQDNVDMEFYNNTKNIIMDANNFTGRRYVEIYKISCKVTNKLYIGQTITHVLNHKRYRPYGSVCRFNAHVSEAFSNKIGQCGILNEDIVKYGAANFEVQLLRVCEERNANYFEQKYMLAFGSLVPNGYNKSFCNSRCLVSKTVQKYDSITSMPKPDEDYLIKTSIGGVHLGWRVRINRIETAFKSAKLTPEQNYEAALTLIREIRAHVNAKHLVVREPPEEPTLPL